MTTGKRGRRLGEATGGGDAPVGVVCRGTSIAFGRKREFCTTSHPMGRYSWGICWKCKRNLGCSTCTTPTETEVLCQYCAAWGTKAAFHHHGPIANHEVLVRKRGGIVAPEYEAYPPEWKRGYEQPPAVRREEVQAEIKTLLEGVKTMGKTKGEDKEL